MNNKFNDKYLLTRYFDLLVIIYIVSLFTVTSHDSLYIINRILFFVLAVSFVFLLLITRFNFKIERIILSTLPFIVITILSNSWALDVSISLNRTVGIVVYFLGAIIIYILIHNKIIALDGIKKSLILSVVILTVTAAYEYYVLGVARGAGVAQNPNIYGLYVVFLAPIIWELNRIYPKLNRFTTYIVIVALIIAPIVSGGRKVLIASVLVFLYFLLTSGKMNSVLPKYIKFFIISSMILSAIFMVSVNSGNLITTNSNLYAMERLVDSEEASFLIRKDMIYTGIELFKNKPFLGYGIDNYSIASTFGTYSHNNYIELLVSLGSFGLVFYYYIYVKTLSYSYRIHKKNKESKAFYLTLFCIVHFFIMEVAFVMINSPVLWILLIILLLINENERKEGIKI
ncbi:O-antigen ligase family protein [Bacillus sp. FJAT-45066]|uniref:O-antigen ligase family protein n=1 Tax=Bacillus sp. FJAT-45066 TaxID=2011010 RepID=UPI0015967476|nr:O-antigen ligase family protein [Bacillus sp. FJAT-45066]